MDGVEKCVGEVRGCILSPDGEGVDAEFLSEGGDAMREGREVSDIPFISLGV